MYGQFSFQCNLAESKHDFYGRAQLESSKKLTCKYWNVFKSHNNVYSVTHVFIKNKLKNSTETTPL